MDERAISLILKSLADLFPIAEQADIMFNARLLETYPDVYRIFAADIEPDERKFVETLKLVLGHAAQAATIRHAVRVLACSHRICRLIDDHYEASAETLIWTLRRSLGANFTAEMECAWRTALHATPHAASPLRERLD